MDRFWDRVPVAAVVLALGASWAVPFAAWVLLDRARPPYKVGPDVLIALWFVTGFPAVSLGGILALANWGKTGDEDPARWLAYTGTALGATGPAHLTLALFGIIR